MSVEDNFIKQAPRPVSAMLLELVDSLPADHLRMNGFWAGSIAVRSESFF
jgi:hypothetical protein